VNVIEKDLNKLDQFRSMNFKNQTDNLKISSRGTKSMSPLRTKAALLDMLSKKVISPAGASTRLKKDPNSIKVMKKQFA
jgi:hypothetical protein